MRTEQLRNAREECSKLGTVRRYEGLDPSWHPGLASSHPGELQVSARGLDVGLTGSRKTRQSDRFQLVKEDRVNILTE
jgi:hypothetical protein